MGIRKVKKIGKFTVGITALNEPSEEAILSCRKLVTKIMNEKWTEKVYDDIYNQGR